MKKKKEKKLVACEDCGDNFVNKYSKNRHHEIYCKLNPKSTSSKARVAKMAIDYTDEEIRQILVDREIKACQSGMGEGLQAGPINVSEKFATKSCLPQHPCEPKKSDKIYKVGILSQTRKFLNIDNGNYKVANVEGESIYIKEFETSQKLRRKKRYGSGHIYIWMSSGDYNGIRYPTEDDIVFYKIGWSEDAPSRIAQCRHHNPIFISKSDSPVLGKDYFEVQWNAYHVEQTIFHLLNDFRVSRKRKNGSWGTEWFEISYNLFRGILEQVIKTNTMALKFHNSYLERIQDSKTIRIDCKKSLKYESPKDMQVSDKMGKKPKIVKLQPILKPTLPSPVDSSNPIAISTNNSQTPIASRIINY